MTRGMPAKVAGLVLLALAVGPAAAQARAGITPETLRDEMLRVHNGARAEVGSPPLAWSSALAIEAQADAERLARTGRIVHSGRRGHRENLWNGTRGAFSPAAMAGYWYAEKRYFVNRPSPDFSTSGNWADVGHYTQMIWSTTREIGCGLARGRRYDILVCRYTPPGNISGQTAAPLR